MVLSSGQNWRTEQLDVSKLGRPIYPFFGLDLSSKGQVKPNAREGFPENLPQEAKTEAITKCLTAWLGRSRGLWVKFLPSHVQAG